MLGGGWRWEENQAETALFLSVSQHDGVPYCHIPCYGYLFGPKGGQPHPRHWDGMYIPKVWHVHGLWVCVDNFPCG